MKYYRVQRECQPRLVADDGENAYDLTSAHDGLDSFSALARAADELGADWDRVAVQQARADQDRYGNQNTDGSRSMRHWYDPMRRAAASARMMLEQAAANEWGVPASECEAGVHEVRHKASGRTLGFGELAEAARELAVPERSAIQLKPIDAHRYIGQEADPVRQRGLPGVRRAVYPDPFRLL